MQDKKWWKIKTADDGANEKGADYQEDDLNRERLCSYLISYKIFFIFFATGPSYVICQKLYERGGGIALPYLTEDFYVCKMPEYDEYD